MASPLKHPFNDPSADVILASSDNVPFKLHKVILSLGSEFFKAMFSLSQPKPLASVDPQINDPIADAEIDGLPVIHVSEPSEVLSKLFRLCYPMDNPHLTTIDEVAAVLTAALKYELRKPIQMTSRRLRKLMPAASVRVYAIACRLDLEDEARAAAVAIREKKLQNEYAAELEDISIGAYHRLLYYCETGIDPGGLFFTRRPTQRLKGDMNKFIKLQPSSVSYASGSITLPESSSSLPMAPVLAPPPHPTIAKYPFNLADPEFVITTSDGVAFKLSQSFVMLAFPVLFDMARDVLTPSRIQIPESSEVLDIVLRIYSPVENPSVTDLAVLDSALIAAAKYKMKKAVHFLHQALASRADVPTADPFALYTIACRHDLRDLALTAARRTLRMELTKTLRPEVEAIDISAGYLYRLLDYHRRCRETIHIIRANDSWIDGEFRSRLLGFCHRPYSSNSLPCWYSTYMKAVGQEGWPSPDSVAADDVLTAALPPSSYSCSYCHINKGVILLFKFSKYVAATIARLESEVREEFNTLCNPIY
uniref:N/A n=1 Tax=Ganoderma boninense TaxID=34458 RepID=A0A5K1K829_9APHY|nr:N/A [Ganoderma boninense]